MGWSFQSLFSNVCGSSAHGADYEQRPRTHDRQLDPSGRILVFHVAVEYGTQWPDDLALQRALARVKQLSPELLI